MKTRTVFTITFITTIVIAALLAMAAVPLAHFYYHAPKISPGISGDDFQLRGTLSYPVYALMSQAAFRRFRSSMYQLVPERCRHGGTYPGRIQLHMSLAWASINIPLQPR